jgi:protein-disulfide isomerase
LLDYDGRVRLVVKDFPLPSHPLARAAHETARCAAEAGRFWPYHDRLFEAQPRFARDDLIRHAAELGIPVGPFTRCLDSHAFAAAVEAVVSQARAVGVRGTPTFFVNGQILIGDQPIEAFRRAVDDALARRN